MDNTALYNSFEKKLEEALLKYATERKLLKGMMLDTPDLDGKWEQIAREYVADAVGQFNKYPEFSMACAAYAGMAFAFRWDCNWTLHSGDGYKTLYGDRGFDNMDDHIVRDILQLNDEQATLYEDFYMNCASLTLSLVRSEGIESGTADALFILVRICSVMFRLGAAIELAALGYNCVKV